MTGKVRILLGVSLLTAEAIGNGAFVLERYFLELFTRANDTLLEAHRLHFQKLVVEHSPRSVVQLCHLGRCSNQLDAVGS